MSDNEPCDIPDTPTENRTSDTETVQTETGQNGHAEHDATETNQTVDLHDQPAHITETVLAHDQHWEEQSSLSSP